MKEDENMQFAIGYEGIWAEDARSWHAWHTGHESLALRLDKTRELRNKSVNMYKL